MVVFLSPESLGGWIRSVEVMAWMAASCWDWDYWWEESCYFLTKDCWAWPGWVGFLALEPLKEEVEDTILTSLVVATMSRLRIYGSTPVDSVSIVVVGFSSKLVRSVATLY